ncbi:MAG: hypothetical protein K6B67_08500 [Lachnospiraceae bacterium]|nr:hypothetical protein [Lachnospiraceae bacterium]
MEDFQVTQIFIESWSAVLCIVFATSLIMIRKSEPKSSRVLTSLLLNVFLLLGADCFAIQFRGMVNEVSFYITKISNFIVYFTWLLMPVIAIHFAVCTIRENRKKVSKAWLWTAVAIEMAGFIAVVISQFNGMFYTISEENIYSRGEYYLLSFFAPTVSMILYVVCIIYHRKSLTVGQRIALSMYAMLPTIGVFFQLKYYGLSIMNISMTASVFVMYAHRLTSRSQVLKSARDQVELNRRREEYEIEKSVDEKNQLEDIVRNNVKHIFIVNPYASDVDMVRKLRKVVEKLPEQDYFIFTTRGPKSEGDMVRRIQHYFLGYKLRIYCCGGSGTLRNIINGIEDLSKVEIAFYPCGLTNDFLKCFGEDSVKFNKIENLIYGDAKQIDYIKTDFGVALNSISVGADAKVIKNMERYRNLTIFGKRFPYIWASAISIFKFKPDEYEIKTDHNTYVGKINQIFYGNGNVLGGLMHFSDDKNGFVDGKGRYVLGNATWGFGILPSVMALVNSNQKKIDALSQNGYTEKMSIRRTDGKDLEVDFDGELQFGRNEINIEMIHKGLNFVVPKGVSIDE